MQEKVTSEAKKKGKNAILSIMGYGTHVLTFKAVELIDIVQAFKRLERLD